MRKRFDHQDQSVSVSICFLVITRKAGAVRSNFADLLSVVPCINGSPRTQVGPVDTHAAWICLRITGKPFKLVSLELQGRLLNAAARF